MNIERDEIFLPIRDITVSFSIKGFQFGASKLRSSAFEISE